MEQIIGSLQIQRFFHNKQIPMAWITANDNIPEWCSLEIIVRYVVNLQHQTTCKLIDCNLSLNYSGVSADENSKSLEHDTKLISHNKDTVQIYIHYRTENYPIKFSPAVYTELKYQDNGIVKTANHSLKVEGVKLSPYGFYENLGGQVFV